MYAHRRKLEVYTSKDLYDYFYCSFFRELVLFAHLHFVLICPQAPLITGVSGDGSVKATEHDSWWHPCLTESLPGQMRPYGS